MAPGANKIEIKKAVEAASGVSVWQKYVLKIMALSAEYAIPKQVFNEEKPATKKAIVQLAEGDSIDFYSNL